LSNHPNILLIMTDEHRPDVTGYSGDPVVKTPNLDSLASKSVNFTKAICPSPVCTPSRMSMLTGKDPHNCAAWNNHWIIYPEHLTWPQHFANNGYSTCLVGKMHFGGKDQMQGFQYRPYGDMRHGLGHQPEPLSMFPAYDNPESASVSEIPESLNHDVVVTRETLAFLREHTDEKPEKPWFVCASYTRPHSPLTAPGRYIRRYRDKVPSVDKPDDWLDRLEPFARHIAGPVAHLTEEQTQRGREAYYSCVDFVDDCIGELLDGLEKDGTLSNTIIIYTADHGEMLGEHGMWGKAVYYDPSISTPLLISMPESREPRNIDVPVSLADLYPTMCSLTNLPIPEGLDGEDISTSLTNPSTPPSRGYAIAEFFENGCRVKTLNVPADGSPHSAWRAIRTEKWKYVEIIGGYPLLYDMDNDPKEMTNLANEPEHSQTCQELKKILFKDFTWEGAFEQLQRDRDRLDDFASGMKPTMPNQYMLEDGRLFDAETQLYEARWLALPKFSGGIIPQQFG
jgi:choline-sulfatase